LTQKVKKQVIIWILISLADPFKGYNLIPLAKKLYWKTDYFVMMVESDNTTTSRREFTDGKNGGGTKHNLSKLWLFDTGLPVHVTYSPLTNFCLIQS
jgi:hypothetical protein